MNRGPFSGRRFGSFPAQAHAAGAREGSSRNGHDSAPQRGHMLVYHFINSREYGPQIVHRRRLNVAMIDQLINPFEFVGAAV